MEHPAGRTCCASRRDAGASMPKTKEPTVNEGSVQLRTDQVAEERDLVGVYLHEISRTPLLDAAQEVDLAKAIEAGLYAEYLLDDEVDTDKATETELRGLVIAGERAKDLFIRANL